MALPQCAAGRALLIRRKEDQHRARHHPREAFGVRGHDDQAVAISVDGKRQSVFVGAWQSGGCRGEGLEPRGQVLRGLAERSSRSFAQRFGAAAVAEALVELEAQMALAAAARRRSNSRSP